MLFSFYLLQIPNGIDLQVPNGCSALHSGTIQQTFVTDRRTMLPLGVVISTTMNGAYDNPAMLMKD